MSINSDDVENTTQNTKSSVLSWEDCSCIERKGAFWLNEIFGLIFILVHHSFLDDKVLTLENQTDKQNSLLTGWVAGEKKAWNIAPWKKEKCQLLSLVPLFVTLGLQPTRLLCPWVLRARILEWVAIPFSKESSWPRDWTALHIDSLPSELPGTWGCTKHQSGLWERSRKGRPEIAGDREMEEVLKRWRQRPSKQPCKMQGFTVFEALGYHF